MANYKRYLMPAVSPWNRHQPESDFLKEHPEHVTEGNAMGFISDNHGEEYNLCHCKSPIPFVS